MVDIRPEGESGDRLVENVTRDPLAMMCAKAGCAENTLVVPDGVMGPEEGTNL